VNVVKRSARVISESASRPPSGFWCLNDRTIKELMNFAKCEKCLVIILKAICSSRHVVTNLITHLECYKDKKNFIK
jgi:hypothetical protein